MFAEKAKGRSTFFVPAYAHACTSHEQDCGLNARNTLWGSTSARTRHYNKHHSAQHQQQLIDMMKKVPAGKRFVMVGGNTQLTDRVQIYAGTKEPDLGQADRGLLREPQHEVGNSGNQHEAAHDQHLTADFLHQHSGNQNHVQHWSNSHAQDLDPLGRENCLLQHRSVCLTTFSMKHGLHAVDGLDGLMDEFGNADDALNATEIDQGHIFPEGRFQLRSHFRKSFASFAFHAGPTEHDQALGSSGLAPSALAVSEGSGNEVKFHCHVIGHITLLVISGRRIQAISDHLLAGHGAHPNNGK